MSSPRKGRVGNLGLFQFKNNNHQNLRVFLHLSSDYLLYCVVSDSPRHPDGAVLVIIRYRPLPLDRISLTATTWATRPGWWWGVLRSSITGANTTPPGRTLRGSSPFKDRVSTSLYQTLKWLRSTKFSNNFDGCHVILNREITGSTSRSQVQ